MILVLNSFKGFQAYMMNENIHAKISVVRVHSTEEGFFLGPVIQPSLICAQLFKL